MRPKPGLCFSAIAALLLLACSCSGLKKTYPGETWQCKTPEWAGFSERDIEKALDHSFTSLTIIKEGYLVYEHFRGMKPGEMTALYSATKSLNSLLAGIAIDRGILRDEHVTLNDYLSEYSMSDPRMSNISLRDILTMKTGIDYDELSLDYSDLRNPYQEWLASEDRIAYILGRPMTEEPGKLFRYQTPSSQLLTRIIEEAAGKDFVSIAGEYLFEPLGISPDRYLWRLDSTGHARVAAFNMVPSDLARIGLLILRNGYWKGKSIVSPDWLTKSFTSYVSVRTNVEFGYHWWLRRVGNIKIIGAEGYGGQCLYIIPGLELVVVITGSFPRGPEDAFRFLKENLIPQLVD